jgi:hypothetical protein
VPSWPRIAEFLSYISKISKSVRSRYPNFAVKLEISSSLRMTRRSHLQTGSAPEQVCVRTMRVEPELTAGCAQRIVSPSSARTVKNKGDLCAPLEIKKS